MATKPATNLMRMGQYVRQMVFLVVPLFLMMQLVSSNVIIENNSSFTVSVYDTNTTMLINPLPPTDYTTFNLGSPGPDFFLVKKLVGGVPLSSCTVKVVDKDTLVLYSSGSALMYVVNKPNALGATGRKFSTVAVAEASGHASGSFCA